MCQYYECFTICRNSNKCPYFKNQDPPGLTNLEAVLEVARCAKAKATKKNCEVGKMKKLGTKNMGNKRCVQCIKDCRMVPRKGQIEEEDVEMEDVD